MVEAVLSYVVKAIDEASSTMDKIKASVGLVGSALGDLGGGFSSVGNIMQGFAGAGVVGAASAGLGELIKGLEASVKQATDTQAIFTTLGAAVERSGTSWKSVEDGTRTALEAMERTTTYSKDQLAGALEKLMTFGLSYDDAMKALGKTIDFAAAKHMDLESAATLVGKAVDGNTAIMKRYGVDITVAKDATDKLTPVVTALNDQFGGAAQAAASTYAGTQERLNHAWSEVSEKVGNILLPALTSVTEAMIPVADAFGKGVDAISSWLTEVGKMPEVQGIMAAVNDAFSGLAKYLADIWKFMVDNFGPALKELMGAFKELSDALAPIGEAIGELRAAFGDTGDIDLFKILIMTVVVQIRAIATIIKDVAPYIKEFADAFKAAIDFMSPILTQIVADVRAFTTDLRTIFQEFYNWLVGGSLWTDMWTQMLTIASQLIGQLISDLGSKLFAPMQTAFTTALTAIQTGWSTAWQAIQTGAQTIWDLVKTNAGTWIDGVKTSIGTTMDGLKAAWETTWANLQSETQTLWGALAASAGAWIDGLKTTVTTATDAIKTTWDTSWQAIQTTFTTISTQIGVGINTQLEAWKTSLSTSTSQYAPIATQALTAMQSSVNIGMQLIQGNWQGALDAISGSLTSWGGVATGIMSGIMGALQGAVSAGISAIEGMFSGLVASAQGTIATLQGMFTQAQSLVAGMGQQVVQQTSSMGQGIVQATTSATNTVTSLFNQAAAGVISAGQQLYNMLVGHSIWPDTMGQMVTMTEDAMGRITSTVDSGFTKAVDLAHSYLAQLEALRQQAASLAASVTSYVSPAGSTVDLQAVAQKAGGHAVTVGNSTVWIANDIASMAPANITALGPAVVAAWTAAYKQLNPILSYQTAEGESRSIEKTGLAEVHKGEVIGRSAGPSSITLQNSVIVDGVTVSRVVEKRLVGQYQLSGGY